MDLIQWSEKFSVEIQEIDQQHQKLVGIVNQLFCAMKENKAKIIISEIISKLTEYTVYHFSTEEKYMLQFEYPGYDEHKAKHEIFIAKTKEFSKKHEEGDPAVTSDVMNFLWRWLSNHILNTDKKFGPFFRAKGLS